MNAYVLEYHLNRWSIDVGGCCVGVVKWVGVMWVWLGERMPFLSELTQHVVQVNSYILHSLIWWVLVVVPMSRSSHFAHSFI